MKPFFLSALLCISLATSAQIYYPLDSFYQKGATWTEAYGGITSLAPATEYYLDDINILLVMTVCLADTPIIYSIHRA